MKDIQGEISKFLRDKKNPTSKRAYYIQQICDTFFTQDDFKKILGQTRQLTTAEIQKIFDEARGWKTNPKALFWKLLKEKNAEISAELKKKSKNNPQK